MGRKSSVPYPEMIDYFSLSPPRSQREKRHEGRGEGVENVVRAKGYERGAVCATNMKIGISTPQILVHLLGGTKVRKRKPEGTVILELNGDNKESHRCRGS